jgi:DNA-binding response OmpR family regulator
MNALVSHCSICGHTFSEKTGQFPDAHELGLPRRERQVLELLVRSTGRPTFMSKIVEELYGDDPDGGPENAEGCAQTHISKLRRKLRPHGWLIDSRRFDGYRLVRDPTFLRSNAKAVTHAH